MHGPDAALLLHTLNEDVQTPDGNIWEIIWKQHTCLRIAIKSMTRWNHKLPLLVLNGGQREGNAWKEKSGYESWRHSHECTISAWKSKTWSCSGKRMRRRRSSPITAFLLLGTLTRCVRHYITFLEGFRQVGDVIGLVKVNMATLMSCSVIDN